MVSNGQKDKLDLPVTLFPHIFLPESAIKKVLSFFGPITICQPWYMAPPAFLSESSCSNLIKLSIPLDAHRPDDDFKARLAEYRAWIGDNRDRGYTAFLQATGGSEYTEDKSWEIRRALRQRAESTDLPKEDNTFRWHLVLHLAKELERQQYEADGLLRELKQKGALLEGALEKEEELESILKDLPQFGLDSDTWEMHLGQIFEAWFSLFGSLLDDHVPLVTWDRKVLNHALSLFEEYGENPASQRISKHFQWPDLSQHDIAHLILKKERICELEKSLGLRKYLLALLQDPKSHLSEDDGFADRIVDAFSEDVMEHPLRIELQYFPEHRDRAILREKKAQQHLPGKTLILIKEKSCDD